MLLVIVIQLALKAAAEVYSSYENVKNMNSIENHLVRINLCFKLKINLTFATLFYKSYNH